MRHECCVVTSADEDLRALDKHLVDLTVSDIGTSGKGCRDSLYVVVRSSVVGFEPEAQLRWIVCAWTPDCVKTFIPSSEL